MTTLYNKSSRSNLRKKLVVTTASVSAALVALTGCVAVEDSAEESQVSDASVIQDDGESTSLDDGESLPTVAGREIPFYGQHMPGIEEDIQAVTKLITFDINEDVTKDDMYRWMRLLTLDISAMSKGEPVLGHPSPGLEKGPSGFSAYVGFGPSLFTKLGLESEMPEGFGKLPAFPGDALQDEYSGGDVMLHIAADDPVVLSQRSRLLIRNSMPFSSISSVQDGFANVPEPSNREEGGVEHRNLFGQIDGTVNPTLDTEDFDNVVWLDEDAPSWAEDGTVLLVRRIEMLMEEWDSLGTTEKEESIGRDLEEGELIEENPEDSHVSLAQPENENERIFRRPFSYEENPDTDGSTNAGLLFLTYQENIYEQFVPIQERLAASDRLNLWIKHIGSSEWIVPGGVEKEGDVIAGDLFR